MKQLLSEHQTLLRNRIAELGLQDFAAGILAGAYSSYLLIGDEQAASDQLGTSRFGGDPDIPADFDRRDQLEELVFIYQVNLADLPQRAELGLPESGLLSVFSDGDADRGCTFFFAASNLTRYALPEPDPEYIFANIKPWTLKLAPSVDLPDYGADLFDEIGDAGLDSEYEELCDTKFSDVAGPSFGQLLGRPSDLNGDMREDAVEECGGSVDQWRSLWKVFSSFESGLVISDVHVLHGMIRNQHLQSLDLSQLYSTCSND